MSKDAETDFSDYGHQRSLQEILEDLSTYCYLNLVKHDDNKIKIILPDLIMKQYTKIAYAKERIILAGSRPAEYVPEPLKDPIFHTEAGTIALFSDKGHSVSKKRKKK